MKTHEQDEDPRMALSLAIDDNDFATFKRLLSKHPEERFLPDGRDRWIKGACASGRLEIVEYLVGLGTDVNERPADKPNAETAIFSAVVHGHIEVVRWMLDHGAEINEVTPKGRPRCLCLIEAASMGRLDMVKLLVERGANVNAFSGFGLTALSYALNEGHTEVADYLRSVGAKLPEELGSSDAPAGQKAQASSPPKRAAKKPAKDTKTKPKKK